MSHRVLSSQQFGSQPTLPVENTLEEGTEGGLDPQTVVPEKEDQDIGERGRN